jgi:hypothetical protein
MLKIKLILLVSVVAACLYSCKSDDILSKRQLEDMLFEMHLSDGVVHTLSDKMKVQNADTIIRYKPIFEKYKCSRDKFEKSMRIYSRKKETISEIYGNIQQRFETALKDFESRDMDSGNFIQNVINKLVAPLKNILSETGKFFENIKTTDDFVEKLLNPQTDIHENAHQDSMKFENIEKKLKKSP